MTQDKRAGDKVAEFAAAFMELNERNQNYALMILRSLNFAQSILFLTEQNTQEKP